MTRAPLAWLFVVALSPCAARTARAQDARLDRLDAPTRAAVGAAIDSARAEGIPADPLVLKALEGEAKHAPGARIAAAVTALLRDLRAAREALGSSTTPDELAAAAAALRAGASSAALERLRAARPRESLVVPLSVLTDFIARGVPADTASSIVTALTVSGIRDDRLFTLRQGVERDIMSGAPPVRAALDRAEAISGGAPLLAPGRSPAPRSVPPSPPSEERPPPTPDR